MGPPALSRRYGTTVPEPVGHFAVAAFNCGSLSRVVFSGICSAVNGIVHNLFGRRVCRWRAAGVFSLQADAFQRLQFAALPLLGPVARQLSRQCQKNEGDNMGDNDRRFVEL